MLGCCSKFSTGSYFTWSRTSNHYNSLQDLKQPPSYPPTLQPHLLPFQSQRGLTALVSILPPLPERPCTSSSLLSTQNALSPHWLTSSSSPPQVFAPISPFQQGLNQHFCWKLQPLNSMPDPPSCPTLNFLFPQHLSPTALAQFLENRAGRNTIPGKQKWGKRGVKQRIEERRPKGVCFPITTGLQATMTWFTERLQRGWTKLMQPQTTSPGKEKRMCPSASVSCW